MLKKMNEIDTTNAVKAIKLAVELLMNKENSSTARGAETIMPIFMGKNPSD
jgi:hypothetical protein